MPYKLSDQEFREALREAVTAYEAKDYPDGKVPEDFKPYTPVWDIPGTIVTDRPYTLQHGPYHFLSEERRKQLLEEI